MDREIKIRIRPDGKVEIDASVFEDCREIAEHLQRLIGTVEVFTVKEELEGEEKIKIEER
ncbi:MAG TPA: DUF2997 domain-containing protein [Deltaproteobacteria bacterium]|nr:DUF2997 domain-containing protein [Deltaproteobacteria bacterium]